MERFRVTFSVSDHAAVVAGSRRAILFQVWGANRTDQMTSSSFAGTRLGEPALALVLRSPMENATRGRFAGIPKDVGYFLRGDRRDISRFETLA